MEKAGWVAFVIAAATLDISANFRHIITVPVVSATEPGSYQVSGTTILGV